MDGRTDGQESCFSVDFRRTEPGRGARRMQREHRDRISASAPRCAEPGGLPGGFPAGRAVPDVERRLGRRRSCRGFISAAGRGGRAATGGAGDPAPLRPPSRPRPRSRRRTHGGQRQEEGAGGARPGPGRGRPARDGAPAPLASGSRAPGGPRCARLAGERGKERGRERGDPAFPSLPFPPGCPTGPAPAPAAPARGEERLRRSGGSLLCCTPLHPTAWNRTRHPRPGLDPAAATPWSLPSASSAPRSPKAGKSEYQAGSELTITSDHCHRACGRCGPVGFPIL